MDNSDIKYEKKGSVHRQWMIAMLANTTLLTYGLQSGWMSPMIKVLQSDKSPTGVPLTDNEISWLASTLCISAMVGVPLLSYIVDTYGRKVGVLLMAALQATSWIIKLNATSTATLIISRIFCGIPAGGCYNVIPMYVKEISQDKIRGTLGSLFTLCQNIGILSMFAMGAYLDYYTVLWSLVGIPIVSMILMLKAPESPAFLVKKGEIEKAASTLSYLRGLSPDDKSIHSELEYMKNQELQYTSLPRISYGTILKNKPWRKAFLIIICLVSVQACSGCFAILTFASTILAASGVTFSPELQALTFPAFMIIGSFISMGCVDRFGRKILLTISLTILVVAMATIATILLIQQKGGSVPSWLPVITIVTCFCAYGAGVSPLPYIIMSETFNFQIRAKVMGCLVTFAWFMSFVQLSSFTPITNTFGAHTTFFFYTAVNLFGGFVTLVFLPETKGKTVEEIEERLKGKK